jgi:hypothetical protein
VAKQKFEGDWVPTRVYIERETWETIQELVAEETKRQGKRVSFACIVRNTLNKSLGLKHLIGREYKK